MVNNNKERAKSRKPQGRKAQGAAKKTSSERLRERLGVDERRAKLLTLGRKLFGRQTYDELSISGIARLAGISKGLLYHYFPTKRDFYVETVRAAAAELLELLDGDPNDTPEMRALKGIAAYLSYVEANGPAYVSLLRSGVGVDEEVADIVEGVRQSIFGMLCEGMGLKRPTAMQGLALFGWIGFAEAVSLKWVINKDVSRDELAEMLGRALQGVLSEFIKK